MGNASQLGITTGDLPSTITGAGPGTIFQTAQWDTYTSNNMVGPEFGMMFEGSQGAWDWYAGGSFTAGFNWQNNIYKGANLPQNLGADYLRTNFAGGGVTTINFSSQGASTTGGNSTSVVSVPTSPMIVQVFPTGQSGATNSANHEFSFSPIGEWRFGGRYRISQSISLNFGYTGMWLSQIARASTNTGFATRVKQNPAAARNKTAIIEGGVAVNQGETAIINPEGFVVGYTATPIAALPANPLGQGSRYVPATITYGTGAAQRQVANPEEFLELQQTAYTAQVPGSGGNEYVLTNGIDFGLEIKY
ncbi:MAG: hypothetical protein HN985_05120 [Planctomycetaceae bacterium]|nr:hypothetical protein [Planctomycetaceae bacterium]